MNAQTLPVTIDDSDDWKRCMAAFLQYLWNKSHSSDTIYGYRHVLTAFFADGKHPASYTRQDVLDFINAPTNGTRSKGKPPAVATINQRLFCLASFYRFATEYTIDGPDGRPARLLQTIPPTTGLRAGQPARAPKAMSEEELEKLFAAIDTSTLKGCRDYCIFSFYLLSARRRSELARLTWGDIRPAVLIEGNTRRNGYTFSFTGKGKSEIGDLQELPGTVYAQLLRYLEMSGRLEGIKDTDPLFVATDLNKGIRFDKSRPLSDETIAHSFKRYARLAGLSPKYTLHSLRHSSALLRMAQGSDILEISRVLRHSSLATTTIYMNTLAAPVDKGSRGLEVMMSRFS